MKSVDAEDDKRIRKHRSDREGWGFTTVEQSVDIEKILVKCDSGGSFLLDSLTALLANEMFPSDENTNPGLLEAMLPYLETSSGLCMDTGHLLLAGQNPAEFFTTYRQRIGEIHLHAVDKEQAALDGKLADHRRLRQNESWLQELLPLLGDYRGIINLEVFSWEEAEAGIDVFGTIHASYG